MDNGFESKMPLRVELGPFEQLFLGKSVLTNYHDRTMFVIEGDIPVLRARDVLSPNLAVSSVEKLYYCVQQMYLEEDMGNLSYLALVRKTISENSNLGGEIQTALQLIARGQHYKALQGLKKLLRPEKFAVSKNKPAGYAPSVASSAPPSLDPA
jgi:flagellar protein FlbT